MLSIVCLKERCSCSVVIKGFIFLISLYIDLGTWGCYKCFLGKYYQLLLQSNLFMSSCALKWNATPLGRVCVCLTLILSEEILLFSLLMVTEFLGFELFTVILSTTLIKSAVSCAAEALQLTELLVLSFVIGSWTSDKPFAVSKAFHGDWRDILTVSPFLARSCVSTEMSVLVILLVEVWVDEVSCLIKFLCVIQANLAVFKLNLRHL